MKMDNSIKNRLAASVQIATAETLGTMSCPTCRGGLDVQFVARGKKGKGAGSLSVMCAHCIWRVVSDGIASEPPWVQVVGPKTRTGASPPAKKRTKPTVTA
jgi:hypothetical protein